MSSSISKTKLKTKILVRPELKILIGPELKIFKFGSAFGPDI